MKIKVLMPIPIRNFYELYKYGTLRLERGSCASFNGYDENGSPLVDPDEFIKTMPLFDDHDQGIILECELDKDDYYKVDFEISGSIQDNAITLQKILITQVPICLQIGDVVKIYPLTENALRTLPMKIGENIVLGKPVFQNLYHQSVNRWKEVNRHKGPQALFEMSGFEMPDEHDWIDEFLQKAEELKSNYRKPDRAGRFILHALVYERREPFPKSDIGILYDLCMILAGKEQMTNYRKTKFYEHLETQKSTFDNYGLANLLQYFEGEPLYEKVRELATHTERHHKDYITAALFTKYKELLRDDKYRPLEMIKEMQELFKLFPEETRTALYLIGAFFDYKRFQNDLYISKRLRIIKETMMETEIKHIKQATPLGPKEAPESQSVSSAETQISHAETEETPNGNALATETEPITSQDIPGNQSSDAFTQANGALESAKQMYPKSETAIDEGTSDNKSLETNCEHCEETPVVTQTQDTSKKGKKRGSKESVDCQQN